jgi:hypothetical protein
VDVQVALANVVETDADALASRLDAGQSGLRRLLHNLAEFARELHAAAPVGERRFDLQDFAANFRPREAEREADLAMRGSLLLAETDGSEHLAHAFRGDDLFKLFVLIFSDKLARHLAAARTDLAF